MITNNVLKVSFPGDLVFGNGVLKQLFEYIGEQNHKTIVILTIDPLLNKLSEYIVYLRKQDINVYIDTSIVREPSFKDVLQVVDEYKDKSIDVVIGIGGGSVLDVAKVVAAQLGNDQPLEAIVGNGLLKGRGIPLICMPTTSGTGSEVSPNAIFIDDKNQKKGVISPFLVPDKVYIDPELTLGLPPAITASTGLDALTHCLEAFTNKFAQPFIDIFAYEGIRLIAENIREAVQNGGNKEARYHVAMGSMLGGLCLGPVNTAAVHALSYPLGSMFNLAHGLSNALLLPYVMEFNYTSNPKKYAQVAIALGCQRLSSDEETAKSGIEKIKSMIKGCGIPARLRDVDVPESAIEEMAHDAMKIERLLVNNPREVKFEDAVNIFKAAY